MKRRERSGWEPQHRASIRHRVAVEAARMLYHREVKEYFHAKREAARRQGTPHLPSNREVHEQLLFIARKVDGDEHLHRLIRMREQALSLMQLLEPYRPRLIGSVLTGHIRKGSDIDLHVYTEELDDVCRTLQEGGHDHVVEVVQTRKYGEPRDFVHVRLPDLGGFEVEITLYPIEALHTQPRCGITGGPMKRATLAELRQLIGRSQGELASLTPPGPFSLSSPLDEAEVGCLLPELLACRGVLQNNYHHLDVFQHTWEVVRGLERMVNSDFVRFGSWNVHLRQHFAQPEARTLLYLAGLCHDLGKPATQTFARDGRIRFPGHDHLGAEMARAIACRIGLDPETAAALASLIGCHLETVMIPPEGGEPSRIHRLFCKVGRRLPELALLSLADVEASRGPAQTLLRLEEHELFAHFLLEEYFDNGFLANPTVPVSVDDLTEQFGTLDAKTQSRLQDWLMAAFVDGDFEGREEGLALAAEFLCNPRLLKKL